MNSYGKTWHTWHTGRHDGQPGDRLPLGDPKLMWSFNRDGEADEALRMEFQRAMGVDETARREQRRDLVEHAHPQRGFPLCRCIVMHLRIFPPVTQVALIRVVDR